MKRKICNLEESGGDNEEVTPVPIPNTAVKLFNADDSWTVTSRENMQLPDIYEGSVQKAQGFLFVYCDCFYITNPPFIPII